ncbi:MAG TPA: hypothetical protein V6C65_40600, partial [Allocoleopsis sp.]
EKEQMVYRIAKDEDELIAALEEFEHELAERCGLPATEPLPDPSLTAPKIIGVAQRIIPTRTESYGYDPTN